MLGVAPHQLEDALRSEKRAKAQLSRRGLLALGASAVATAILPERAWSFARPSPFLFYGDGWCMPLDQLRVRISQPFYDALLASSGYIEGALAKYDEPLFPS